jgi:outer membrane biosynthesis protein TonB
MVNHEPDHPQDPSMDRHLRHGAGRAPTFRNRIRRPNLTPPRRYPSENRSNRWHIAPA